MSALKLPSPANFGLSIPAVLLRESSWREAFLLPKLEMETVDFGMMQAIA
jgi:hypothetical protein